MIKNMVDTYCCRNQGGLLRMENLDLLIKELVKQPQETAWLEFKLSNDEQNMIGERI